MIDDLVSLVGSLEFEESEGVLYIDSIQWESSSHLLLTIGVWIDEQRQDWNVICKNVVSHHISNHRCCLLQISFDHPVLFPHIKPSKDLFISSQAVNTAAVFGQLAEAHMKMFVLWYPIQRFLNHGVSTIELLAGGHGLLATGPEPLIDRYREILDKHNIRHTVLAGAHGRPVWNVDSAVIALILNDSFVAAHLIEAERK